MKAGTAQGRRKITPKIRFPLINGWLAMIAVKIPMTICKVEADKAQMIVQERTEPKGRTEGTQAPNVCKVCQTNPVQQFVWWQVLEVVVGKGNHQGYDNWEDDCKSHSNVKKE